MQETAFKFFSIQIGAQEEQKYATPYKSTCIPLSFFVIPSSASGEISSKCVLLRVLFILNPYDVQARQSF